MVIRSPSAAQPDINPDDLPLQRFYLHERLTPDRVYLTQPFDGGQVRNYTWRHTGEEVRRMAAFLRAQAYPPGSRIAILGKNSAGWIMADLAIWMAGHVSVPLYPMLTAENIRQIVAHSESVACFIGKLDDQTLPAGIPQSLLTVALSLADKTTLERCSITWGDIVANTPPLDDSPLRIGSDLATIVYTWALPARPKASCTASTA